MRRWCSNLLSAFLIAGVRENTKRRIPGLMKPPVQRSKPMQLISRRFVKISAQLKNTRAQCTLRKSNTRDTYNIISNLLKNITF